MPLLDFINDQTKLVALTGAGISTNSGIPAYRDENGNWMQKQPVQHQDFMTKHSARQRFWARSIIGWPVMRDAQPNDSHILLANLESSGLISQLITQNVDGLHQKAGHQQVIDLHGRSDRVICMDCGEKYTRNEVHDWMAKANPSFLNYSAETAPDGNANLEGVDFDSFNVSDCPSCGSILKPDVVFFGDNVEKQIVEFAKKEIAESDGLLVIGSSLMVYSGYRFCKFAHQLKKPIVILNRGKTRADHLASFKTEDEIQNSLREITIYKGKP